MSDLDEMTASIVRRWRERGFPLYCLSPGERRDAFDALLNYPRTGIIRDATIKQTMHGLSLAWHYHPHHWNVRVGRMLTPLDVWESDELFERAVRRRLARGGYFFTDDEGADLTAASLRKGIATFSGVQRVSNFRPTAAAAIYDRYADGAVWDMSCGFGGRLLAAIVSPRVSHYYGCDPASLTMSGLREMSDEFAHLTGTGVSLVQCGSEEFVAPERVSLCFTSPPYFDREVYSMEESQSCHRFRTVDAWNDGFLRRTIVNCRESLRDGGLMVLNVANVRTHPSLEGDAVRIAVEEGFVLEETLRLALSSVSRGGFKFEPVFVFRRR